MIFKKVRPHKKACPFKRKDAKKIDYKDPETLKEYITVGGKISSRKMTGVCAKHQRKLATAIKNARFMALLPFVDGE